MRVIARKSSTSRKTYGSRLLMGELFFSCSNLHFSNCRSKPSSPTVAWILSCLPLARSSVGTPPRSCRSEILPVHLDRISRHAHYAPFFLCISGRSSRLDQDFVVMLHCYRHLLTTWMMQTIQFSRYSTACGGRSGLCRDILCKCQYLARLAAHFISVFLSLRMLICYFTIIRCTSTYS